MRTIKLVLPALGIAVALMASPAIAADKMMMAKYKVVDDTIPKSLTGKAGDPTNGRKIAIDRRKGNCLACHEMPIPEQPFHGKIGPNLNDVANRYSASELRMRVVNPKVFNEDTIMPAYYKNDGFHRVLKKFKGKTIISAQEVEDVIAYMLTLKK